MFSTKAGPLGWALALALKHQIRLAMPISDKHSRLLDPFVGCQENKVFRF